jgi:hypothetical protein
LFSSRIKFFEERRNSKMKKKALLTLFLVFLTVIQLSVVLEQTTTSTLALSDPEPGEITSFFDTEAVNISYSVAPSTSAVLSKISATNQVYYDDRALVRAGTMAYDLFEFDESTDIPMLHKASPELLRNYYNIGKLTGEYRLNKIGNMVDSFQNYQKGIQPSFKIAGLSDSQHFELMASLSVLTLDNTSDIAGYNVIGKEKLAVSDLRGKVRYEVNVSDSNQTIFSSALDASFQQYAEDLVGNNSDTEYIKTSEVDDEKNKHLIISGFLDIEKDGLFDILKANYAVQHSTTADQVTPDRITILDYTVNSVNLTKYIHKSFADRIISALEEEELTTNGAYSILGFKFAKFKFATAANAKLAWGLSTFTNAIGKVYTDAKAIVSAPLTKIATTVSGAFKAASGITVKDVIDKPLAKISGAVDTSVDLGKSIVRGTLSAPTTISKAGSVFRSRVITPFVRTSKNVLGGGVKAVGGVLTTGSKFVGKSLNTIVSLPKSILGGLTKYLIYGGLALVGLVAVFILYNKFMSAPPADQDRYKPY